MRTTEALDLAAEAGLDLVEMNSGNDIPIAKIMDFGKFKYEQKKRAAEAKKNQKTTGMRDVWIKPFIEENDLNIKMKKTLEFLAEGDKVKISVMTKGNKKVLARGKDAIPELFEKVTKILEGHGVLESKSKPDERTKSIIIAPVK